MLEFLSTTNKDNVIIFLGATRKDPVSAFLAQLQRELRKRRLYIVQDAAAPRKSFRVSSRDGFLSSLGFDIVSCKVGPRQKRFKLHVKLASLTSGYFGEKYCCPICSESSRTSNEGMICCREECGVAVHRQCMSEWKVRSSRRHPSTPVKCPGCGEKWTATRGLTETFPDVDEHSFDIYTEWLYCRRVSTGQARIYITHLIEAYAFGTHIRDEDFCAFILEVIIEQMQDNDTHIEAMHVRMAYRITNGPCSLRELLVNIYKTLGPEHDLSDNFWEALPSRFWRDVFGPFTKESQVGGTESRYAKLEELKTSFLGLESSRTESRSSSYVTAIDLTQEEMTA